MRARCSAAFVAYDLLKLGGDDWHPRPTSQRRAALEVLIQGLPEAAGTAEAGLLRLSPQLPLDSWEQLEPLRQQAASAAAEGLMLKHLDMPYLAGRKRCHCWKHKRDPYRLDAVLLYAQAGCGRRANLFIEYTFGLWNGAPGKESAQLVSFAKAYSGLNDGKITALDRWMRRHITELFGPVRAKEPCASPASPAGAEISPPARPTTWLLP